MRLAFYHVPMFVHVVKMTPRIVMYMFFAVTLTLLVFAVAAASFLGLTLAVQGWATSPPTTIQAPVQPYNSSTSARLSAGQ
jgi:hypothetical protein